MPMFYLQGHKGTFPIEFSHLFLSAQKAIECGNVRNFRRSLDGMGAFFARYPTSRLSNAHLDVSIRQQVVSRHRRARCYYFMSLLAYAALYNQKEMVEILIERRASTWITSTVTGSPLTQVLLYSLHHGCPEMVDTKMMVFLINSIPPDRLWEQLGQTRRSNFDQNIYFHIPEVEDEKHELCSPVEIAIQLQRIDIAKKLVQAGADPICALPNLEEQILPLFLEFFEFGTNRYMSWLLHEHLPQGEVSKFIENVLQKEDILFCEYAKTCFLAEAGRHHIHAPLTCGHEEMIWKFLDRYPMTDDGEDTLRVKDSAGRTALQIAAANGDLESVSTLLKMYKRWIDGMHGHDGIDIAKALLYAAKGNHVNVVDILLRKDDDAFHDNSKRSVLHVEVNGNRVWKIAVLEGLSCIFETLRHYDQRVIAEKYDEQGNTLGHIAAMSGNVSLFKVTFPLRSHRKLSSDTVKDRWQCKDLYPMFWSLVLENKKNKTPLMVAIDNNHYSILESLQKRTVERELRQNAKQNKEKTEWEYFWTYCGSRLLLHACSSSSSRALDSIKVLVKITKSTLGHLPKEWVDEAFGGSTKAGNDDALNYLLQTFRTFIDQELKNKALLDAADCGHHRCVKLLLKNGADVKSTAEADDNNCLMKAIEKNHRETVLTILTDGRFGPEALRFVRVRATWRIWKRLRKLDYTQPIVLLIKEMPDIAEWVLNKCALSKPPPSNSHQEQAIIAIDPQIAIRQISNNSHPPSLQGSINELVQRPELPQHVSIEEKKEETDFGGNGIQHLSRTEELIMKGGTDYIMTNKFEILETPTVKEGDDVDARLSRWFRTHRKFTHPIQTMLDYNRADMLNHNLVQTWIHYKLKDVIPDLVLYLILYILFLTLLTIFAILLPRPGPWNQYCVLNETVAGNASAGNNRTITLCEGQSRHLVNLFYVAAVVLILASVIYLTLEGAQLYHRLHRYLLETENYVQVVMFVSVIIFAFPVGQNSCWCLPGWKWQIGALAVFLAWINLLLVIRYMPWLRVGEHTTMLFNVYINFAKLIYLPILIVVTFAVPLYMLLVDATPPQGGQAPSLFTVFASPFTTLYKVVFLSSGEIEADDFINSSFHYVVASYALFITFVVAMPILFNNFLIGMAVGETQEERNKAYLSLTKRKIYYIFEVQNVLYRKVIPFITRKFRQTITVKEMTMRLIASEEKLREFRAKDKAIKDDIKSKIRAQTTRRRVKRLGVLINQNQTSLTSRMIELEQSLQTLSGRVGDVKEEIGEMKESVANVKADFKKEKAAEKCETKEDSDIRSELSEIKQSVDVVKTMINLLQLSMSNDRKEEVESDL